MTPCEKLGYKVGDRFEVTDDDNYHKWPIGTIVVLHTDDKSVSPKFRHERNYDERCYMNLDFVKPLTPTIKTGDTIERDGKKYRVTLEEIPQYDFKPGMLCRVDWDKADASCACHAEDTRVVYLEKITIYLGKIASGRGKIAYATIDGFLAIGFVNTSSLRPE